MKNINNDPYIYKIVNFLGRFDPNKMNFWPDLIFGVYYNKRCHNYSTNMNLDKNICLTFKFPWGTGLVFCTPAQIWGRGCTPPTSSDYCQRNMRWCTSPPPKKKNVSHLVRLLKAFLAQSRDKEALSKLIKKLINIMANNLFSSCLAFFKTSKISELLRKRH